MSDSLQEIKRAIDNLTPDELQDLYSWFEQNYPQSIDGRITSDLEAGRLDTAIFRALDDENSGRTCPL